MKLSWGTGNWDHIMLWASATLCFLGFFRSGEITVPSQSSFDRDVHLSFGDVSVDNQESPRQLRVRLKASKTDPFRAGVDVFVGATGNDVSCVRCSWWLEGQPQAHCLNFRMAPPLPGRGWLWKSRKRWRQRASITGDTRGTASGVVQRPRQHGGTYRRLRSRCWADGKVMPFNFTSKPPGINWRLTHIVWLNPHKLDARSELY